MLNSLSCMLFGSSEQDVAGSMTTTSTRDEAASKTQVSQEMNLSAVEEDMGWVLVDALRKSSPSQPQSPEEKDTSLRGPDGSIFDGVLDLTSSCSSISDAEADENDPDRISVDLSSMCGGSYVEDSHVSLSSPCFGLSVILKSNEESDHEREDPLNAFKMQESKFPGSERLTDSWMITPPPCFTGTEINKPLQSSPLENKLIECASFYACLYLEKDISAFHDYVKACAPDSVRNDELAFWRAESEPGKQESHTFRNPVPQSQSGCSHVEMTNSNGRQGSASRSVVAVTECVGAVLRKKQALFQQRHQKAAAKKFLTSRCIEHSNKARMVQSSSRKQMSAHSRLLKPSGSKCGRYCQRAQ